MPEPFTEPQHELDLDDDAAGPFIVSRGLFSGSGDAILEPWIGEGGGGHGAPRMAHCLEEIFLCDP